MEECTAKRSGRRRTFSLAGAMTALLVGASVLWSSLAGAHGRCGRHGPFPEDPESAREHASFFAAWMLRRVNASEEQQQRAEELVSEAATELFSLGRQHRENRAAFLELLAQPELDRAALEELRQDELALADRASRRLVETLAQLAEVLTPEQRVELARIARRFGPPGPPDFEPAGPAGSRPPE